MIFIFFTLFCTSAFVAMNTYIFPIVPLRMFRDAID